MKHNFINLFMREPGMTEAIAGLTNDVRSVLAEAKDAKQKAYEAETSTKDLVKQLMALNDTVKADQKWREEAAERYQKDHEDFNKLQNELKQLREGGIHIVQPGENLDFATSLAKAIGQHSGDIKGVNKKSGAEITLETGTHMHRKSNPSVGNMTTPGNLTGSPNITYVPQPVLSPRQLVNFRDLVPGFQSETGLIALFRENVIGGNPNDTPEQGAFAVQATQGSDKNQVGYTFTNVQFNADYISGYVRISKQMLQDILFLQTYLPQMLLRDYYKAENSIFYAAQAAASLGSTTTSGGNDAEKFIDYLTNLESTNFAPNGFVTTPAIWGKLMKTTVPSIGTSYSAPGGFYINPMTGYIEIAGVPVIKATWIPSGAALVGDWTQSQVATVDGLKVEFFEQDYKNVTQNLITVRVECRCVLVTGQPYAFVSATGL